MYTNNWISLTPIWCVWCPPRPGSVNTGRCLGMCWWYNNYSSYFSSTNNVLQSRDAHLKVTRMLLLLFMASVSQLFSRVGSSLTVSSNCESKLGMESGKILDRQLSASSSDGSVVGPHNVNIVYNYS